MAKEIAGISKTTVLQSLEITKCYKAITAASREALK